MIRFSIIIPVYNGARYISNAESSVINQTFNKDYYEIIIVDDSSTDESRIICKKIIEKNADKNISLYSTDYTSGPGIARNIGIKNAKGEFLIFLDCDDLLKKNLLNILFSQVESTDNAEIVVFDHEEEGIVFRRRDHRYFNKNKKTLLSAYLCLWMEGVVWGGIPSRFFMST